MSTKIRSDFSPAKLRLAILGAVLLSASAVSFAGQANDSTEGAAEVRTSISLHRIRGGRNSTSDTLETTEDYAALKTSGDRNKTGTRGSFAKPGLAATTAESQSFDFWFYEADVILYNDDDNDGFFHGIDLLFDVDTNFAAADIYAVLYLSFEGGPWNEYASTDDFTIYGASGSDEYVLETELMSGYLTGSYDLLIEVFDAYDGAYLVGFGPEDTSELAYLALEDFNRDAPLEVIVVRERGGGGSIDQWFLSFLALLLAFSAVSKIRQRRNAALVRIDSPAPCWQACEELQRRARH